ncbi:hypothetical protein D3C86_1849840 [compost metagenome]
MVPRRIRPGGIEVEMPPDSVCPQASSIGKPSARYQRIRSGEIGAAPVTRKRQRWIPMKRRTLFNAANPARWYLSLSQPPTGWPASTRSATAWPTDNAQAYSACCSGPASFTAIVTAE